MRKVGRCCFHLPVTPQWCKACATKEFVFCWAAWSGWKRETAAECGRSLTPLEALLPQVLEEQWGFRLCLLERDLLPGGGESDTRSVGQRWGGGGGGQHADCPLFVSAYTSDVVLAIQRSQMLVCVLSADYLADSNAVFVLESGVQVELRVGRWKSGSCSFCLTCSEAHRVIRVLILQQMSSSNYFYIYSFIFF